MDFKQYKHKRIETHPHTCRQSTLTLNNQQTVQSNSKIQRENAIHVLGVK